MDWRIPQEAADWLSGNIRIYPGIWNLYSNFKLLGGYSMTNHIDKPKIAGPEASVTPTGDEQPFCYLLLNC